MAENQVVPQRFRLRKSFRIGLYLLICLFVTFLALWNFLPLDVARSPVVLSRNEEGKLVEQSPKTGVGLHWSVYAGKLKSEYSGTGTTEESPLSGLLRIVPS